MKTISFSFLFFHFGWEGEKLGLLGSSPHILAICHRIPPSGCCQFPSRSQQRQWGRNFSERSLIKVAANQLLPANYGRWVTRRSPKRYLEGRPDGSAVGSICERRWCDSVSSLLFPPSARYNRLYTEPNAELLHPYSMVTASRNNSQLESGFMNKWSIPRRPHFPRFGPFSWAHCWPWKEVI